MHTMLIGLAIAAMVAVSWAAPVAAGSGPKSQAGSKSQSGATSSSTEPRVVASSFTARVTGEVSSVDKQSGKLTLKTPDGPLTVTFPPVAVQNVKQGDMVTVAVGLVESNPSASPTTGGGSTGSGSSTGSTGSGSASGSSGSPAKK
jgi:hypothetical protein